MNGRLFNHGELKFPDQPRPVLCIAHDLGVQVSIQTRKRPLSFCAHHSDNNFAALVVRGCDRARHIGDLKAPVDRNPSSARTTK